MPEKVFDSAGKKTAMLTCKITLPDSPHPLIISKNPQFRALYLAQHNEFHFFRLINTKNVFSSSSFFGCWFLPENLAFARKIMVLPESGGCSPPAPLARTPMRYTPRTPQHVHSSSPSLLRYLDLFSPFYLSLAAT